MRTTIDLPDALFRQAKASAAKNGLSLKDLVTKALTRELDSSSPTDRKKIGYRVQLPLIRMDSDPKTRTPINLTNEDIGRIFEEEDLAKLNEVFGRR